MNKQELDIWLEGCINYYNKKTNNNMASIEERIKQLEQAHGRLFNQQKELIDNLTKLESSITKQIEQIGTQLKGMKQELPDELPETLIENKKYNAIITDIVSTKDVKWRNMDYTNWEIKLKGKEHIFLAFIKTGIILEPGMLVQFSYKNYLKLTHLKPLE
jgi:hypothetical protein